MEKTEACAILRIPIEASHSDVETAFHKRMHEVRTRFDAARGMSLRARYQREFDTIRDARDCFLGDFIEIGREQPTIEKPLVDEPKLDDGQFNEVEVDPPRIDELPVSEPRVDEEQVIKPQAHKARVEKASVDARQPDERRTHEPHTHESRVEEGQVNAPKAEEPRVDEGEADGPQVDEPKAPEARAEAPRLNELPKEAPAAFQQPATLPGREPTGKSPPLIASTPGLLRAGQLFLSRFELLRELEVGSTGAVWLAQDHVSEQQIELIFVPGLIMNDKAGIDNLRNEIGRRATLKHSNISQVFGLLEDKGRIAVEVEFPVGRSLSELRFGKPNHVFEVEDLEAWVKQLCEALQYAHEEAGLAHGNIQPGNLIVDNKGSLKVKDFAISSCLRESISRSTRIPKTSEALQYKSPQQAAGKVATVTDDLYSLGATLYESLTSRPPFSAREIALQENQKKPPTMTERRAELGIKGATIPLSWEETVAACLATDPTQRPQSAADVARRLQKAVPLPVLPAGAPTSPPPPPPAAPPHPPPLSPSVKPGPAPTAKVPSSISTPPPRKLWMAIAGIFLVLAIGSVIASVFHFPAKPKQGKLFVQTKPDQATVFIDGVDRGTTPLVLENVAPGDHRLTIALTGYRREELIVPVKRSAPDSTLQIDLVQIKTDSPSSAITASQAEFAAQQSSPTQPTSSPEVSTTPSAGGNAGVDEKPSPGANEPTSPRVSETPSSELSKTESAQEAASSSESLSATATPLSRREIDVTKEEVIKRISALPGLSTAAKDRLIEKMDRARSMERLTVIPFDFGQTVLRRGTTDKLVQTFDSPAMRETLSDPTIVLVVAGYADAGGRPDLNLRISQQRAAHVTKILKERANLLNAMQTIGMGGSELLDSSRPDQNRAVEVWAVVPY